MCTVLPIWIEDSFKPAGARWIEGKEELLSGLDIVRKLDITVVFGIGHFMVGQGELEMMTYNGERHWVFPLVPTAFEYAKLDGYFWKMQKSQIVVLKAQAHFGGSFGCAESNEK